MPKSLSALLSNKKNFPHFGGDDHSYKKDLEKLQQKMLRIQQAVFHKKERVIILFEGFDAAGKGGTIRNITEMLDPRSFRVHPIGAPSQDEQGRHWQERFWKRLPEPGQIAIFDRTWYGRVLVEKVDKLTSPDRIASSYEEINELEATLIRDGFKIIKIFLAISKDEQLKRFKDRLDDPYKQWKISMDDINNRKKWKDYVHATDEILKRCSPSRSSWLVIPANSKKHTRIEALKHITSELKDLGKWMEKAALSYEKNKLKKILQKMES